MDKQIGNYKIDGLIGQGSMGKVYLGKHPILGQEVAIKVLSEDFSSYPELVKRFRREARAIAAIRHKAIVKAFDFGDLQDGRSYYVMELLKGQSLQAYMKARGPLPLDEATAIILPLSEALGVCHKAGFIHRDIKPENVFLTNAEDGSVFPKIIDFGIAKLKHPDGEGDSVVTRMDAVMGTPLYMAPEQGPGVKEEVGPWSDVYSLAATLYHMLAYRPPFYSESPMELIIMHTHRERPQITEIRKDLPDDLARVLQKAMAIQPSERFQSMAEFAAAYSGAVEVDDSVIAPGALADLSKLEGLEGEALEAAIGGMTIVDSGPICIGGGVGDEKKDKGDVDEHRDKDDEDGDEVEGAIVDIDLEEPSVIVESDIKPIVETESEGDDGSGGGSASVDGDDSTDWASAQEFVMDAQVAPEIEEKDEKRRKTLVYGVSGSFGILIVAFAVWFFVFYETEKPAPPVPAELVMISSKNLHVCGVEKSTGRVMCWGRNNYGQLGVGDKKSRSKPQYTGELKDVISISAGGRHSCAVERGGSVWCWGKNKTGQLGDTTLGDKDTPVKVKGIQNAASVHTGSEHTCVLLKDGSVECWGWNLFGQLGDGSEGNMSKEPVRVAGLQKVKNLAAGGFHNCAVTNEGKVLCWGKNDMGQLGLGDERHRRVPELVKNLDGVKAISAGGAHTCVVLEEGHASCWGRNASGQVGAGDKENIHAESKRVLKVKNFESIAAGGDYLGGFSCAVDKDKRLWCWGNNLYGQVGGNSERNYRKFVRVSGVGQVSNVVAGGMHTCVLSVDGVARCWGRNNDGQLGVGNNEDKEKPSIVIK